VPVNEVKSGGKLSQKEYEKLLRQVADRVWEMWREDLRRSRERRGKSGRK